MENFLNISPESFKIYKSGNLFGNIFININDRFFPNEYWTDFVLILVNQWVENLSNTLLAKEDICELRFMDGPFGLLISIDYKNYVCSIQEVDYSSNYYYTMGILPLDLIIKSFYNCYEKINLYMISIEHVSDMLTFKKNIASLKFNYNMLLIN